VESGLIDLAPEEEADWGLMAWATPQYSRSAVDRAGAHLIDDSEEALMDFDENERAFSVISNWRSSHYFPLNTFQNGLRSRSKAVAGDSIVAQRIKRLSSISAKLRRFPTMRLSMMQDIGGCRSIVRNVAQVRKIVANYEKSDIKHKVFQTDDYIDKPKESGYRGVHLIFKYFSDKNETYNGLKIEVQVRSNLQHAWATAVETTGTFIGQALKSSQGEADWLRFFCLMGSAIAIRENTNPVPDTPTSRYKLRTELRRYAKLLDVESHLRTYGEAIQALESFESDAHYYLLELDPASKQIKIKGFKNTELDQASSDYLSAEKSIKDGGMTGRDAVLVSVDSIVALRRAYPNYFLDTHLFIDAVKQAIS
jgi:hypothetical protein